MGNGLAIHSKKGKASLVKEAIAIDALERFFKQSIARTRTGRATLDGIMHVGNLITAVVEIKSRGLTLANLKKFKTGLVTEAKLIEGRALSEALQAPFYLVFLLKDNKIVIWEISDKNGTKTFTYEVKRTRTKKTVEGGSAFRLNGFLPVDEAMIVFDAKSLEEV